jgi:cullin-associated NEDD8-dissociated protein 1
VPILISHSRDEDEQVRNIVAESIGRLFAVYPATVILEDSFTSSNVLERRTIVRCFKYSASKETDPQDLMLIVSNLVDAVKQDDLEVKQNALESITAIAHNHPSAVRQDIAIIQNAAIKETPIRLDLITEVDLGPFKHKEDKGVPIRKAAFSLLETLIERIPERLECNDIVSVSIKGLDDLEEACII